MTQRLPTLLVAAWLFAVISAGNVLLVDKHYVMRCEMRTANMRRAITFRCFEMVWHDLLDEESGIHERTEVLAYPDAGAQIRGGNPDAGQLGESLGRLSLAGAALFWLVCAAPLCGLLALLWRGGSPALRHVLLLLGALAPLAALEYFGAEVDAYRAAGLADAGRDFGVLAGTTHATFATWAARAAWNLLALAAAVSWWRWPKRR